MTASIKSLEQIGAGAWVRFIEEHPLGNIYHHAAWHEVIEKTYGYRGSYCVLEQDHELLAALPFVIVHNVPLPTRLVSYPYSDACDPLVGNDEELQTITNTLEAYRRAQGIRWMELRTFRLGERVPEAALNGKVVHCNFILDLRREVKQLFRKFHKNCVQRAIKSAESSGIEIVEGKSLDDMKEFYNLHVGTRKLHGVPPQPFRFFSNLWEILYPRRMLSILLARINNVPAAAIVQLKFKDTIYYKFAASERRFLVKRPNHLLIWNMIRNAVEEGYTYMDFGRTAVTDEGLMQWKSRWGAERKDFTYVYPVRGTERNMTQEGSRVNTIISSVLRRMPASVVRMSGEMFYRYLA